MSISVAVVGCGGISATHIAALMKLPNVKIVSVCDVNEARAKVRAQTAGCGYTLDWKDYISDPSIDVIHLCTPHYLHAPMAIAYLNAGKRVLSEKPMASEVKDAEDMIAASKGRLAIVFQNRYNTASQIIKEAVDTQKYGKLLGLRGSVFWHRTPEYYTSSGWRGKFSTEGGGALINQSIHTLDLLLYFGGKPTSVRGSVSTDMLYETIEVEDSAHCLIKFESGITASFYATNTFCKDMPVEIEAVFENAVLHMYAETLLEDKNGEVTMLCKSNASGDKAYWGTGHLALLSDFYKAVEEDRPFWIDGESAIPVLKVLKGVYRSSETKETVAL